MYSEWKDFMVGKLRTNCSKCRHFKVDPKKHPCDSCIKQVNRRWGVDFVVTGENFEPENQQYFENLKTLHEKYNQRLTDAEKIVADIKNEIAEEAQKLSIDTNDFYYARKKLSPRPGCDGRPQ